MEEIGKVRLDYSQYSGRDYYSEGAVEDALLDIVTGVLIAGLIVLRVSYGVVGMFWP